MCIFHIPDQMLILEGIRAVAEGSQVRIRLVIAWTRETRRIVRVQKGRRVTKLRSRAGLSFTTAALVAIST